MSKRVYFEQNGAAKRVKKLYLGVDGTARKVRRAYLGVEGIARACLGPGAPIHAGTASPLITAAWLGAAARAGEKLLFAGGSQRTNSMFQSAVTAYDAHLTVTAAENLSIACQELAGASVGGRALFAGGDRSTQWQSGVNVYDADLTRTATGLSASRSEMAAGSLGGYAIFAGGYSSGSTNTVDAFTQSLTRTTVSLDTKRYSCAGARAGAYFLVAGGASTVKSVEVFDESLTRTAADDLSEGRYTMKGLTHMGKAMIVGGWGDNGTVDVYDESLTHLVLPSVNVKAYTRGAVLEDCAIFHGGRNRNWSIYGDTVVFDENFTATQGPAFSAPRWGEMAGTVGEYALFAGGGGSSTAVDTVDIFRLD